MTTFASVFNSSTVGIVLDYESASDSKKARYLVQFDYGTFWVYETQIINMWNGDDDDE